MKILRIAANGAKLLRKDIGIPIKNANFENIVLPVRATTFDAVRVQKGNISTDIFTFRTPKGRMLSRIIRKDDGKTVKQTFRKYFTLFNDEIERNGIVNLFSRRISSYTRTNGKLTEIGEDVITHSDEAIPVMTRSKRVIRPNYEAISIEQKQKGTAPKFIRNEYETDITSVGDHTLLKSEVSSPELKEIAEHPYFLAYTSPNSKFARRLTHSVVKEADFIFINPKIKIYKKPGRACGYYGGGADESININVSTRKGLIDARCFIADTAGHEVEHAKWDEKSIIYQSDIMYNSVGTSGLYTVDEIPLIKKYIQAQEDYVPPEIDIKKYFNNFTEVIARQGGTRVCQKYIDLSVKMNEAFPSKHLNQFYDPHPETLNDESFIQAILAHLLDL